MENRENSHGNTEPHLSWETPEYKEYTKTTDWFWGIGIVSFSIAFFAAISGNVLFGIFIILGTALLFIYAIKKPQILHVVISEHGVEINSALFPYKSLESFGVTDNENSPALLLKRSESLRHHIVLPLAGGIHPKTVREHLKHHLPEAELKEPFSHTVTEYIGF